LSLAICIESNVIIECILYRKYYWHYSSIVISTITIVYCPTHINRKWLAKPNIKSSNYSQLGIRAFCHQNSSPPLAADFFSLPLLNGFYCCSRWLLPQHRWCSPAGQPSTSHCRWCSSTAATIFACRTCQWLLLACFCHSSAHYGNTNSSHRRSIQHLPSCFVETYEHKLSLLANADEALSSWSRCFSLRWRLCAVSPISCFWQFCWFFFDNQPFFSSLEATWSTYFECITLLSLSMDVLHPW